MSSGVFLSGMSGMLFSPVPHVFHAYAEQMLHMLGVRGVEDLPSCAPETHQVGLPEHTEMVGDGRRAHVNRFREVPHTQLFRLDQGLEDHHSCAVPQDLEQLCALRIQAAMEDEEGVHEVESGDEAGSLTLRFDPARANAEELKERARQAKGHLDQDYCHHTFVLENMDCADCARSVERAQSAQSMFSRTKVWWQ